MTWMRLVASRINIKSEEQLAANAMQDIIRCLSPQPYSEGFGSTSCTNVQLELFFGPLQWTAKVPRYSLFVSLPRRMIAVRQSSMFDVRGRGNGMTLGRAG